MSEPESPSDAADGAPLVTDDAALFASAVGRTGRLMALDLGTKTLGLAVSDPARMIASPLKTLKRGKFTALAAALKQETQAAQVVGLILGLPFNLDGSAGPRVQATHAFARNLAPVLPLPMLYWDERMTTIAAERSLLEADASRRRRAEVIDAVAAALILQGALERLQREA